MDIKYLLNYEDVLEVLIKYYKHEVDTYYLAFAKYNLLSWAVAIFYFLAGSSLIVAMAFIKYKYSIYIIYISLIIMMIALCMLFVIGNKRNKYRNKLLQEKYAMKIKNHDKVNDIASVAQMFRVSKFLEDNLFSDTHSQVDKEKIITVLIEKLEEKTLTKITNKLFIPGIFAALFIPTWVAYLNVVFSNMDVDIALKWAITYSVLAVIVSIIIGVFTNIRKDMSTIFEDKDKRLSKALLKELKKIHFRIAYGDDDICKQNANVIQAN